MFYCESCASKNGWPTTLSSSHGRCEVCEKVTECNDYPSYKLPRTPEDPRTKVTTNPFNGQWVLKYPDGTFVGVDVQSGGYPHRAHHPHNIHYFNDQDLAEDYRGHFPEEKFSLHEAMSLTVSLRVRKGE